MICSGLVVFLLVAAAIPGGQAGYERLSAEEVLCWFPLGDYTRILHYEPGVAKRGEAHPVYVKHLGHQEERHRYRTLPAWLPPRLKNEVLSVTNAHLDKTEVLRNREEYEARYQISEPTIVTQRGTGSTVFTRFGYLAGVCEEIFVLRFGLLDPLIEKCIKSGEIADTGIRIAERPVYSFHYRLDLGEGDYFAYATITGDLLLADKMANLERMVQAGLGLDLNILDGEDYLPLVEIVPDLGHIWIYDAFSKLVNRVLLEQVRRTSTNDADLEELEESLASGEQYSVSTTLVTDEIVDRQLALFGSEDEARAWAGKMKTRFRPVQLPAGLPPKDRAELEKVMGEQTKSIQEYNEKMSGAQKTTIEDGLVTVDIVYSKELISALRKLSRENEKAESRGRQ